LDTASSAVAMSSDFIPYKLKPKPIARRASRPRQKVRVMSVAPKKNAVREKKFLRVISSA
jgi:S-adenosylmethionine:tRNA-ribosyltransferase-isomerase (queuine synthetase)